MLSPEQTSALAQAAASATACERSQHVPAELTLAQWALESGWGAHQPGNNCFGIKAYPGCPGIQLLNTVEYVAGVRTPCQREFATFPTLNACFAEHARLFAAPRYRAALASTPDIIALIQRVSAVYATDPHYADLLLAILKMPQVQAELARARAACAA